MQNIDQYKAQLDEIFNEFDRRVGSNPLFVKVKEITGIRPAHVSAGILVFAILFALFGIGSSAVCNLVGFIYPAYASFKAIKSQDKDDDTQWLTYWVVYAFFVVIESLTDILVFWIPFYYLAKVAFLVWCFAPQTQGATRIFNVVIEPLLSHYEASIDSVGAQIRGAGKSVRDEYKDDAAKAAGALKSKATSAALSAAAAQASRKDE